MASTFGGLEIVKRGALASRRALEVVGHNVANAGNDNYSRQKVTMSATEPIYPPGLWALKEAGQVGTGVEVAKIARVRHQPLDDRIWFEKARLGYLETRENYLSQLEMIYNEPTEVSLRNAIDHLWATFQDLANHPEEYASRAQVREAATALANRIRNIFKDTEQLRKDIDMSIKDNVKLVNSYARKIAVLNRKILKAKSAGYYPNDLMDKRDALIEELAEIAGVSVTRQDKDDSVIVYLDGEVLVQGGVARQIKAVPSEDPLKAVRFFWKDNGHEVKFGGKLRSLIELRDNEIAWHLRELDSFALSLIDYFNSYHKMGFDLDGNPGGNFFKSTVPIRPDGKYDFDGDGVVEVGIYKITGTAKIGGNYTFQTNGIIEINGTTVSYQQGESIRDFIDRVNAAQNLAYFEVDPAGRLVIRATSKGEFHIRTLRDVQGNFLAQAGLIAQGSAFDYKTGTAGIAGEIEITPAYGVAERIELADGIKNDLKKIAAASGVNGQFSGPGDGKNALLMASLKHSPIFGGGKMEMTDFFDHLLSSLGVITREAKKGAENQRTVVENLLKVRQEISGVSLDEEMVKMIMYQHAFSAAARMINLMDQMLDTIVNKLKA